MSGEADGAADDFVVPTRFDLSSITPDGEAVYLAQHELHNNISIVLPAGYWGDGMPMAQWFTLKFEFSEIARYPNVNISERKALRRQRRRCPDCGEPGQIAGHQTCPTPQDHP